MQNIVIADNSCQCRILWENEIRKMELQKSIYTESTIVVPIEDIGEIADPSLEVGRWHQENDVFLEGEIIGLISFEGYISCIGCKGKVTEETFMMGECSKCRMKVKPSWCTANATANVVFKPINEVK